MAGWTLVPESPQTAPPGTDSSRGLWTPVDEPNAPPRASQPQESALGELGSLVGGELFTKPLESLKLFTSLIHAKMLGTDPHFAYQNYKNIDEGLRSIASDYDEQIGKAAKSGVESPPLTMLLRGKPPEPFESNDLFLDFIHDMSDLYTDPTFFLPMGIGKLAGYAKLGTVSGFALSAGLRRTIMDHYQKGNIKDAGELVSRAGSMLKDAAIGAAEGYVMGKASELPVGKFIARSPMASTFVKGMYQSALTEITGAVLNWQVPTLQHFERTAVMVSAAGLAGSIGAPEAKQGMMDVYAKDGTTPEQTATKLQAQPPVKPDLPEGLKPAIQITAKDGSKQVITGDANETHSELAERVTGEKPVTIEELEADAAKPRNAKGLDEYLEARNKDDVIRLISDRELNELQSTGTLPTSNEGELNFVNKGSYTKARDLSAFGSSKKHLVVIDDSVLGETDRPGDVGTYVTWDKPLPRSKIKEVIPDIAKSYPKLADKVLAQPEIQVQQVIDRAYELKDELDPTNESANQANLKSGRGFAIVNGADIQYLKRDQASRWVKNNEPEIHDMWTQVTGNEKAEFHSEDYQEARKRVAQRNVMEGEPQLTGVAQELQEWLAKNRSELNIIKASDSKSDAYGDSVLRTTLAGPKGMVRAFGEQYIAKVAKLLPNYHDQEALDLYRDYRDDPEALRTDIEEVRRGDNVKLQRAIPSMEKALSLLDGSTQPTKEFLDADKQTTEYLTQANALRSQFVGTTSSIDPSRYSPRMFMRMTEEEEASRSVGSAKFSKRSPHDIRREYLHKLEPLKEGDIEARTFNIIDELRVYNDRLANSVANSVFQMELKNTELGKFGVAGEMPPELRSMMAAGGILTNAELEELGGIPKNWVSLPGTQRTVMRNGREINVGLQVPPKVAEAMAPMLEHNIVEGSKLFRSAKLAQGFIKAAEVGLIPFHLRSMAFSFMNNAGIDAYREAMLSSNNSPRFEAQERKAALFGVTTTKTGRPFEAYRGLNPSSIEDRGSLLKQVAKGAWEPADKLFKGMTKATFEVAQRKFKVIDFSTKEAAWLAKHPQATDAEYGTAMRSIAKEVNAVYGGLNWDVMGVSANYQAWSRFILLAPDWTFSNFASLKYAAERGTPAGKAARSYWLKSYATGFAMSQGMSMMLNPNSSLDDVKKRAMEHPFEVYLGQDSNGKEMYTNLFLVGAPKDSVTLARRVMKDGLVEGTGEFASYKLGPLVGTGFRTLVNKDWQGKPITTAKDDAITKTGKDLLFGAEQLAPVPFTVKDVAAGLFDPNKDVTYKDFLAGLVGASVYHEGPKEKGVKLQGSSSRKGFHLQGARR